MRSLQQPAWQITLLCASIAGGAGQVIGAGWAEEHARFPFVVRTDAKLDNATAVLSDLVDLQAGLEKILGVHPPREWIEIYVFRDQSSYRKFVGRQFPGNEKRRALFIQGRGPAMVLAFRSDTLEIDLRHETTHALLHAHTPHLPLWLDEGLAEYFEKPADQRHGNARHAPALFAEMCQKNWPKLEALERKTQSEEMDQSDYLTAWIWARYLIDGPAPVQVQLRAYLAEAADRAPRRTLPDRLRELDPDIERAMLLHWQAQLPKAAQVHK